MAFTLNPLDLFPELRQNRRISGGAWPSALGSIEVTAFGKANQGNLRRLEAALPGRMMILSAEMAQMLVKIAQEGTPEQRDNTQGYQQNIHEDSEGNGHGKHLIDSYEAVSLGNGQWLVRNTAPWAASVEFGARPHTISGTQAHGNLVFWWDRKGGMEKTPAVAHPGQPGQHYLQKATNRAAAIFPGMIRAAVSGLR